MAVYVKEYDWMWLPSGLNLSPVECRIYAYIYGLTESKTAKIKGYNGSTRQLSRTLGLSLGMTSIVLNNLQNEQLIVRQDGVYRTVQSVNESVQPLNDGVQSVNDNVQPLNESVQSLNPRTPIYINKEKIEENNACDTIDTHKPSTSSFNNSLSLFDQLLTAYKSLNPNTKPSADALAEARTLWDNLPDYKQHQLLEAVQNNSWNKSRLDWLINDYHNFREPFNYLGKEQPKGYSYFFAVHNGKRGLYTKQDVEAFHLTNVEPFMDL